MMSINRSATKTELSPVDDFHRTLDRIEQRIVTSRESYREKIIQEAHQKLKQQQQQQSNTAGTPPRRGLGRFLIRGRSSDEPLHSTTTTTTTTTPLTPPRTVTVAGESTTTASTASPSPSPSRNQKVGPVADFIPMDQIDVLIEDLRRIAELCIIGENFVTKVQKRRDMAQVRAQRKWAAARDALLDDVSESEPAYDDETTTEFIEKMQLFDLFFERNALLTIVNMLNGESFNFDKHPRQQEVEATHQQPPPPPEKSNDHSSSELHHSIASIPESDLPVSGNTGSDTAATTTTTTTTLLPPLSVATQALQSISILIQNVSRVTSLYAMLSNNNINTLIDLPLHLYTVAEKRRYLAAATTTTHHTSLPAIFASPAMTELSTHFVTFLKSLALRMNAETLQFFIRYHQPSSSSISSRSLSARNVNDDDDPGDTTNDARTTTTDAATTDPADSSGDNINVIQSVEFPLYIRALEFCAAHQDSFVRTTALNICLNTLRLTTITDNDDQSEKTSQPPSAPNAILHNAMALPYHERLVIAQYACIPSRVEHLISPIFTKLAEHWTAIDEQIRLIDSNKHMGYNEMNDEVGVRNERVAMAKEKVRRDRLLRNFKDKVADLQDELLLLDDVFQVGLTVLNEQLVETMLATFVYPMLLQPLVIYCQRLSASVDEDRFSFSEHPFGRISADLSDVEKSLSEVAGPAKAALYTLASVFKYQSNRPLLRLLFTVLFHPLAPDSTSAPTVRSKLEVAELDNQGRKTIRLDVSYPLGEPVPNERTTYDFGTDPANRRRSRSSDGYTETGGDSEACIFVLAPALAEILEFRGNDISLIARTRPNPYRQAFFKCLTVPDDMSDIREIAVCTFDSALSSFQGNFGATVLFGTDLKTFADDIPADERKLDSMYAHLEDDRGIGGSADYISRRSISPQKGGSIGKDLTGEVISALCGCVAFASRVAADDWKLGYDHVAAHVLLMAVQHNSNAAMAASKIMENRYRQAAVSIAELPSGGLVPMGGSEITLPGSPDINDPDYDDRMFDNFINLIFYDTFHLGGVPVAEDFLILKEFANNTSRAGFSVQIAAECNLDELCSRVGKFLVTGERLSGLREFNVEMIEERREGARVWFKVGAILSLLQNLGRGMRDAILTGVFVTSTGETVKISDSSCTYAAVSARLTESLYEETIATDQLNVDAVVDLDSTLCIPCVCEVMGPLDTTSECVQSEGVTWQSLYIILHQDDKNGQVCQLGFAQVLPATGNSTGRIVSVGPLDRITVESDITIPVDGSPARRLSLYYKWFDQTPPHLFMYDTMPTLEEEGDFFRSKSFTSRIDIWLENEYSANQAFDILSKYIFMAKAQRGRRILSLLDPNNEPQPLNQAQHMMDIMLNAESTGQQQSIPKRPFGSTYGNDRLPPSVSIVGLGCSSFSTFFWSLDELSQNSGSNELAVARLDPNHPRVQSWIDAIEYAITVAGITVLDTAPWYGHGTSEVVVGLAMTKLGKEGKVSREHLTINTKIGRYEADPPNQFDFSSAATMNSVKRSVRRLCCGSYIDVLQLHDPEFAPSMDLLFQETIPAMIDCQKNGWCRALGMTGYPLLVQHQILERSMRDYGRNIWDQSLTYGHYNLHDSSLFEDDMKNRLLVNFCKQQMIQVIAAAPLSMGLLTQRGPPEWHPAASDLQQACRRAVDICQQHQVDISTLAILFALSNPQIPTTILGMSTIEEVKAVHNVALRFVDVDTQASTPQSQDAILQSVLSTAERKVLYILRDREHGPFASVWKNGSYQWDGVDIAHAFWRLVPEQQVVSWQKK